MEYLQQGKRNDIDCLRKYRENQITIENLKAENKELNKKSFDSVVRKVIDNGMVYIECRHRTVKPFKNIREAQNTDFLKENKFDDRYDPNGTGRRWFNNDQMFFGQCEQCQCGVNRHDCSVEGETYFFTCDEARVINNLSRQYGITGSIQTATRISD